jgi:hypothetical protein
MLKSPIMERLHSLYRLEPAFNRVRHTATPYLMYCRSCRCRGAKNETGWQVAAKSSFDLDAARGGVVRACHATADDLITGKLGLLPAKARFVPYLPTSRPVPVSVCQMNLVDRIAQCREPFIVEDIASGILSHLSGAAEYASRVAKCPIRYVLSDDLTRLCTALAYSKGSRTVACADLLHVPAETVWVEWCEAPWRAELEQYGFGMNAQETGRSGRRGAFIQSSTDGRRGLVRTFWSDKDSASDVLASSMEAYFDFDTAVGEDPHPIDAEYRPTVSVSDGSSGDLLRQCLRFRYERSWDLYYRPERCTVASKQAIARHALGTIAPDIPVLLAFLLLLGIRSGVSHRPQSFAQLNRSRARAGKTALLDHVEVHCPVLVPYRCIGSAGDSVGQRARRLHHVRGHLVRRGNKIFWRIPHLRGSSRTGSIRTRTVTWTVNEPSISSLQHFGAS